jgi:hypothetical protein
MTDLGVTLPGPAESTSEVLAAYHKAEVEKRWPTVKATMEQS